MRREKGDWEGRKPSESMETVGRSHLPRNGKGNIVRGKRKRSSEYQFLIQFQRKKRFSATNAKSRTRKRRGANLQLKKGHLTRGNFCSGLRKGRPTRFSEERLSPKSSVTLDCRGGKKLRLGLKWFPTGAERKEPAPRGGKRGNTLNSRAKVINWKPGLRSGGGGGRGNSRGA